MHQPNPALRLTTLLALLGLLASCASTGQSPAVAEPERLRAHVEFLAADELAGRNTGSKGYLAAADYVAAAFARQNLTPAGDNGSWFQSVPLVEASLVAGSAAVTVHSANGSTALAYPSQFIMGPDLLHTKQSVSAELVFVGYGIVAPDFNHDDYHGLDVKGKIVVMLEGRPMSWPSEEGAHLGSGREKARHAAEHGAIGRLVLHTPREEAIFPWEDSYVYLSVPRMNWVDKNGIPYAYRAELRGGASINTEAASKLFAGAIHSAEEVFTADSEQRPIAGFPLATSVTLARESQQRRLTSPNVVGILEGSDPDLRNEYLVYSAHLDHLGIIDNKEGEAEIYNGALDNAAGIATLLETVRLLAAQGDTLKRSVLFIAVTGEEKGLLGAGYFAAQPTVPVQQLVANINLDMPILLYPFADVIAFGAQHSSLKQSVATAAEQAGITLAPDPMPEQAIFVRSDHYRFVQQGVPAVMLATGFTSQNPKQDGAALSQDFLKNHYHKPSDQTDLPIDYQAAAVFTQINVNIGSEICNASNRPTWNDGDFFGRIFSSGSKGGSAQ